VSGSRPPRPRTNRTRERIVDAFTERARSLGPRSVVMAELARDLGISTRTLYKHFRSKAELMHEVIGRYAEAAARDQESRFSRNLDPLERILETAYAWLDNRDRFSAVFWREAHQQYPEAVEVWRATRRRLVENAKERALPDLPDDLSPDLAIRLLFAVIEEAADPVRCDRLGISRHEAVSLAARVFVRGAVRPPRLRLVETPEPD